MVQLFSSLTSWGLFGKNCSSFCCAQRTFGRKDFVIHKHVSFMNFLNEFPYLKNVNFDRKFFSILKEYLQHIYLLLKIIFPSTVEVWKKHFSIAEDWILHICWVQYCCLRRNNRNFKKKPTDNPLIIVLPTSLICPNLASIRYHRVFLPKLYSLNTFLSLIFSICSRYF